MSYRRIKRAIYLYDPDIKHAHDYRASCYAALFKERFRIIAHIHGNREEMHKKNQVLRVRAERDVLSEAK